MRSNTYNLSMHREMKKKINGRVRQKVRKSRKLFLSMIEMTNFS